MSEFTFILAVKPRQKRKSLLLITKIPALLHLVFITTEFKMNCIRLMLHHFIVIKSSILDMLEYQRALF